MLGASKGIGFLVLYSQQIFMYPNLYAAIITISVIGIIFNSLLVRCEKKAHFWKEEIPR